MADQYRTVAGFIQFDPDEAEASGQTIRRVLVQAIGSEGVNIRVTVWPEYDAVPLNRGDFIIAQGKFEKTTVKGNTYLNLSARSLIRLSGTDNSDVEGALEDEEELLF